MCDANSNSGFAAVAGVKDTALPLPGVQILPLQTAVSLPNSPAALGTHSLKCV